MTWKETDELKALSRKEGIVVQNEEVTVVINNRETDEHAMYFRTAIW